jgi:hypothetical protein
VGMAVAVLVVVAASVLARHAAKRTRCPRREHVPVGPRMWVAMDVATVAMTEGV